MRTACGSVVVVFAVTAMVSGTPVGADNSGNAALCQYGGWETLVDPTTGIAFSSQGACVSYGALGGAIGATIANVAACESVGGTFGADNQTIMNDWDAVLWSCNGFWADTESTEVRNAEAGLLAESCMDDSPIPNTHLASWDDATHQSAFTCGLKDPFNR